MQIYIVGRLMPSDEWMVEAVFDSLEAARAFENKDFTKRWVLERGEPFELNSEVAEIT